MIAQNEISKPYAKSTLWTVMADTEPPRSSFYATAITATGNEKFGVTIEEDHGKGKGKGKGEPKLIPNPPRATRTSGKGTNCGPGFTPSGSRYFSVASEDDDYTDADNDTVNYGEDVCMQEDGRDLLEADEKFGSCTGEDTVEETRKPAAIGPRRDAQGRRKPVTRPPIGECWGDWSDDPEHGRAGRHGIDNAGTAHFKVGPIGVMRDSKGANGGGCTPSAKQGEDGVAARLDKLVEVVDALGRDMAKSREERDSEMHNIRTAMAAQRSDLDAQLGKLAQIVAGLVQTVQQRVTPAEQAMGSSVDTRIANTQATLRKEVAPTPLTQGDSCTPLAGTYPEVQSEEDPPTATDVGSEEASAMEATGVNKRALQGRSQSRSRERRARRSSVPSHRGEGAAQFDAH